MILQQKNKLYKVTIVSKSCASFLEMVVVECRSLPRKSENHCKSVEFLGKGGRFTHEGGEKVPEGAVDSESIAYCRVLSSSGYVDAEN